MLTCTSFLLAAVCVYKGVSFKQGESWKDGCDLVCICENGTTGFYRCDDRLVPLSLSYIAKITIDRIYCTSLKCLIRSQIKVKWCFILHISVPQVNDYYHKPYLLSLMKFFCPIYKHMSHIVICQ